MFEQGNSEQTKRQLNLEAKLFLNLMTKVKFYRCHHLDEQIHSKHILRHQLPMIWKGKRSRVHNRFKFIFLSFFQETFFKFQDLSKKFWINSEKPKRNEIDFTLLYLVGWLMKPTISSILQLNSEKYRNPEFMYRYLQGDRFEDK